MKKTKIRIGIDEAGRGPWAGPVVACALTWDPNTPPGDLVLQVGDSKTLSEKKRECLYEALVQASQEKKLYFGVGVLDNHYIDESGIKAANKEAMRRALGELLRKVPKDYEIEGVLIDGNDGYTFEELRKKPISLVGGDGKIPEIGAASIIAKVFRDKLMTQYATLYPDFGFSENAGYGTKKHQEQLETKYDITGIHRLSYKPIKEVLEKKEKVLVHICCGPDATVPLMDLKNEYEIIAYWYDPNIQPFAEHEKRYEAFVKVCEIEGVKYIKGDYDVKNFFKRIKGLEDTPERGEKCTHCYDMRLERTAKLAREMGITNWTSSLNNSPHKDMEKMFALGEKWDRKNYHEFMQELSETERNQAVEALGESGEEYMKRVEKLSRNTSLQLNPSARDTSLQLSPARGESELRDSDFSSPGRIGLGEVSGGVQAVNTLQEKLEFLKIAFRKNGGFQRSVDYTNEHGIYRQNYCGCVYSDTFPGSPRAKNAKGGFSG